MDKDKFILATIASAVTGTIVGLLCAPEKGSKTREKIIKKGDKYLQELKKELEDIRRDLDTKAKSTKADIDEFGVEAKRKGEDLLKKAKKITSYDEWTKEELYNRAKQLEIENYSTMNKAELIKALRNY